MSRNERSFLEQALIYEIQIVMVLAAVLLVEADGYDVGDEVDFPEQMLMRVVAESVRRMKTRRGASPQECDRMVTQPEQESMAITRRVLEWYETLQPLEGGKPLAYHEEGYRMTAVFRDLRELSDEQLTAVVAHTFLCLDAFLSETYDFPAFFDRHRSWNEIMMYWGNTAAVEGKNEMYRIRDIIPAVRNFAKQVELSGLAEEYGPALLFAE